jgi:hypothetical protein
LPNLIFSSPSILENSKLFTPGILYLSMVSP